jgi:hypothetical protein
MKRKKKYPRHCCKKCNTMHRTYASAQRHKAEIGSAVRMHTNRRRRKTRLGIHANGFGAMPKKKRVAIARKGGLASARARGY